MLQLSQFDFEFPESQIAQRPMARGDSRMMVISRSEPGRHVHDHTRNLITYLSPGDGLVLNNTRVIPARMFGTSASGAKVEILLLRRDREGSPVRWEAMVRPGKRCRPDAVIHFDPGFSGFIRDVLPSGNRIIEFPLSAGQFQLYMDQIGKAPIPPYIKRKPDDHDLNRYQSVFAVKPGSVAAPTASLHLTRGQLKDMEKKGIELIKSTLHVGPGTFLPVKTGYVEEHLMHKEYFEISPQACESINRIKRSGKKIWAVGTTVARILETVGFEGEAEWVSAGSGMTDKFIYPGYQWRVVDCLLTNFHWPRSTLFMLVCSLLGTGEARNAYQQAFINKYRLFSYGDAMLIF
ncbi:tRNA preQ1(34) S-adenosylmethionine ribosyltransferase-isomerase QueA [Fibrobacterota bacterium]